jgi:hypothetical protein
VSSARGAVQPVEIPAVVLHVAHRARRAHLEIGQEVAVALQELSQQILASRDALNDEEHRGVLRVDLDAGDGRAVVDEHRRRVALVGVPGAALQGEVAARPLVVDEIEEALVHRDVGDQAIRVAGSRRPRRVDTQERARRRAVGGAAQDAGGGSSV